MKPKYRSDFLIGAIVLAAGIFFASVSIANYLSPYELAETWGAKDPEMADMGLSYGEALVAASTMSLIVYMSPIIFGFVFAALGAVIALRAFGKGWRSVRLKREGIFREARITDVYYNRYSSFDRDISPEKRRPIAVECDYKHPNGTLYNVKSDKFWPNIYVRERGGKDCLVAGVWASPKDPRDYYVEVSAAKPGSA